LLKSKAANLIILIGIVKWAYPY